MPVEGLGDPLASVGFFRDERTPRQPDVDSRGTDVALGSADTRPRKISIPIIPAGFCAPEASPEEACDG